MRFSCFRPRGRRLLRALRCRFDGSGAVEEAHKRGPLLSGLGSGLLSGLLSLLWRRIDERHEASLNAEPVCEQSQEAAQLEACLGEATFEPRHNGVPGDVPL